MEVKKGYKQTEIGVIPEDWNTKALGVGIKLFSGHHILAKHYNVEGKGVPYITGPADFQDGTIRHSKFTENPSTLCIKNDILITVKGSGAGTMVISDSEYSISRQLMAIRTSSWDTFYLYSTLKQDESLFGAAATGLIPGLSRVDILEKKIPIPPTKIEQTAIATALSDADALINSLKKLIAIKQAIKLGTMQLLLTGKKRLPGFSGEWEVKRLGEACQIDPENLSSNTSPEYNFDYISLEDVDRGVLCSYSNQIFSSAPSRARRILRKHDILFSTVRPNLKSHLLFNDDSHNFICSTGFSVLRCFHNFSDSSFIYQQVFSITLEQQIEKLLSGSNYPAISSKDVKSLTIPFPPYDEQLAISTILTEMDYEIKSLKCKISKYRQIKQAMMQNLLTGKIRLI